MKEKRLMNKDSKALYFLIGVLTALIVLFFAGFILFENNINLIAASDLVKQK